MLLNRILTGDNGTVDSHTTSAFRPMKNTSISIETYRSYSLPRAGVTQIPSYVPSLWHEPNGSKDEPKIRIPYTIRQGEDMRVPVTNGLIPDEWMFNIEPRNSPCHIVPEPNKQTFSAMSPSAFRPPQPSGPLLPPLNTHLKSIASSPRTQFPFPFPLPNDNRTSCSGIGNQPMCTAVQQASTTPLVPTVSSSIALILNHDEDSTPFQVKPSSPITPPSPVPVPLRRYGFEFKPKQETPKSTPATSPKLSPKPAPISSERVEFGIDTKPTVAPKQLHETQSLHHTNTELRKRSPSPTRKMQSEPKFDPEMTCMKPTPAPPKPSSFRVHCICRKPETDSMVQCDMCDEWYHLECVGLTEAQAQQIDKYFCAQCVPPEKKRRIVSEISNAIRSREALSKSISSTPSIVLAAPLQFVQAAPPKRNTSDATCKRPNKKDNTKTKPKENGSSSEEGDGGLVSLSSLARKPWLDGWVTARAFALRYLQEAKNMAIQAGVPLAQARQLPKQLAVRAANRGKRAWRQAEMLLAVQFLKEAGLVETSTKKGTFIKDPAHTFSDLIALVKKVEMPGAGNAKKMKIVDFSSPHADTLAEEDTAISEQGKFCNKQ